MDGITVGCDPELAIQNSATEKFVSAHDIVPGSKKQPSVTPNNLGAVQVDGVAAEFNIAPAEKLDEWMENIADTLLHLDTIVREHDPKYDLFVQPTVEFSETYWKSLPSKVKAIGCSPDYCIYNSGKVPNQHSLVKTNTRHFGGHVFLGWGEGFDVSDTGHIFDCRTMIGIMDRLMGLFSFLWDDDLYRRRSYGALGNYRVTNFGVEYRTLSNAWVADPDLQRWVFLTALKCMELFDKDERVADDANLVKLAGDIMENKYVGRRRLANLHNYCIKKWDVPALPDAYWKKDLNA